MTSEFVVVTVPGLRGRDNPSLDERVAAIQETLSRLDAPVILVAHSAGALTAVHWASRYEGRVAGALLATPPDLLGELPPEYPWCGAVQLIGKLTSLEISR